MYIYFPFCIGRFQDIWHFPGLFWKNFTALGQVPRHLGICHINIVQWQIPDLYIQMYIHLVIQIRNVPYMADFKDLYIEMYI